MASRSSGFFLFLGDPFNVKWPRFGKVMALVLRAFSNSGMVLRRRGSSVSETKMVVPFLIKEGRMGSKLKVQRSR